MGLKVGDEAVCVVKATNVIVEIPSSKESASVKSRLPSSLVAVVASSWRPARRAAPRRRARRIGRATVDRRRRTVGRPVARRPVELTVFGAASLKGVARQGQGRLRGGAPGHDADDLDRLVVRARDARSSRAPRPTSSCRPTRRTRRSSSTRAWPTAPPSPSPATSSIDHRPDGQPGRDQDAGRPRQAGGQDHRRRRRGADHEVREPARRQPRQGSRLSGRLRRRLHRQHRVQGGQRQGRRRQDRARRGRRRHRLRHRRQGLDQGHDGRRPRCRQRPRDVRRRRRQGLARTPAAARAFLDWFAGPDGQAILGGFGFLPPS